MRSSPSLTISTNPLLPLLPIPRNYVRSFDAHFADARGRPFQLELWRRQVSHGDFSNRNGWLPGMDSSHASRLADFKSFWSILVFVTRSLSRETFRAEGASFRWWSRIARLKRGYFMNVVAGQSSSVWAALHHRFGTLTDGRVSWFDVCSGPRREFEPRFTDRSLSLSATRVHSDIGGRGGGKIALDQPTLSTCQNKRRSYRFAKERLHLLLPAQRLSGLSCRSADNGSRSIYWRALAPCHRWLQTAEAMYCRYRKSKCAPVLRELGHRNLRIARPRLDSR